MLVVGALSLPVAAALDADRAWWDYGGLTWFGDGKRISFDWTHSYGPLDWPRDGTTLLYVKSDRPHYWKAETLDVFDGFRWARSPGQDNVSVGAELPLQRPDGDGRWDYYEVNPAWNMRARFTVRSLSTDLIVGAGVTYMVDGVERRSSSGDGTMVAREPLRKGDSYEIGAYAPDPSAAQMRGAPDGFPGSLAHYTQVSLPAPGESALDDDPHASRPTLAAKLTNRPLASVPLRDSGYEDSGLSARQLRSSPYAGVYDLARRLTDGQRSSYDAVKSVENYLQRDYTYSERPPSQRYPLAAFLFEDRIGYCQQFSGAMTLMLRMAGIPARIASGFSPGSYNKDSGEYRVRDLDAHSWVEIYFTGIGWVPFDPTPSAAPAQSQSNGIEATSAARGDAGEIRAQGDGGGGAASERGTDTGAAAAGGDEGGSGLLPWTLAALVAFAGSAVLSTRRLRRRRALTSEQRTDAQLVELRRALERLGWEVPADTTLLDLERRLERSFGPGGGELRRRPARPSLRSARSGDARGRTATCAAARAGCRWRSASAPAQPAGAAARRPATGLSRLYAALRLSPYNRAHESGRARAHTKPPDPVDLLRGGARRAGRAGGGGGADRDRRDRHRTGQDGGARALDHPAGVRLGVRGGRRGSHRPGHLQAGGRGRRLHPGRRRQRGQQPLRRAAERHRHRLGLPGRQAGHDPHQRPRRRGRRQGLGPLRRGQRLDPGRGQGHRHQHGPRRAQDRSRQGPGPAAAARQVRRARRSATR